MKRKTREAIQRLLALLLAALVGVTLVLPATAVEVDDAEASVPEVLVQESESDEQAAPKAESGESETTAAPQVFLEFYVLINGKWERVATQYTAEREGSNDKARFYTTAENLETVYRGYGFRAADYNGELFFPHTDTENMDTLWADAAPYQADGQWRIPLSFRNRIFVYYLPHNTPENAAYFNTSAARTDETLTGENSFYTVSVSDPSGTETAATGRYHVLTGASYTVLLTQAEGRTWKTTNLMTGEEVTPDERKEEDGKLRITFDAVTFPLKIASCSETDVGYTIRYHAATLSDFLEAFGHSAEGPHGGQHRRCGQHGRNAGKQPDFRVPPAPAGRADPSHRGHRFLQG